MKLLGNILWIIFGGLVSAISWFATGLLWCITVVGIPVGVQCFKIGTLTLCPFGKDVSYEGGAFSFLLNILWFFFGGFELFIINGLFGILLCITIIGIPFGKQFFKIAKLALSPFGATVK